MGYFGALVLERERMSCVERRLVLRVYIRYCTSYGEDGLVHRNNTNELVIVTECVFWSRFLIGQTGHRGVSCQHGQDGECKWWHEKLRDQIKTGSNEEWKDVARSISSAQSNRCLDCTWSRSHHRWLGAPVHDQTRARSKVWEKQTGPQSRLGKFDVVITCRFLFHLFYQTNRAVRVHMSVSIVTS